MRLFAAVDLSRATRDAMAAEQQRLSGALGSSGASLKWVRPETAHLTLVFLGHVDASQAPSIVETMNAGIDLSPFDVVFSGAGIFPPRGAPRVLWTGLAAGARELASVQRVVATRIATHGVALEARDFHPHLTLARWSSSRPTDRASTLAAAGRGMSVRQHVARVTLFESRLSASGAAYTALAHANLTGA